MKALRGITKINKEKREEKKDTKEEANESKLSCIRQKTIRQQIIYRQDQNNSVFLLNTFSHQETRQTKYSCNIRVSISHLIPILYITNIYRRVSTQNIGRYQPILSSLSTPRDPLQYTKPTLESIKSLRKGLKPTNV